MSEAATVRAIAIVAASVFSLAGCATSPGGADGAAPDWSEAACMPENAMRFASGTEIMTRDEAREWADSAVAMPADSPMVENLLAAFDEGDSYDWRVMSIGGDLLTSGTLSQLLVGRSAVHLKGMTPTDMRADALQSNGMRVVETTC